MHCFFFTDNNISSCPASASDASPASKEAEMEDIYLFLDPHLRPVTPDFSNPRSRQIYEEHKQLAQEFLQVVISITWNFPI